MNNFTFDDSDEGELPVPGKIWTTRALTTLTRLVQPLLTVRDSIGKTASSGSIQTLTHAGMLSPRVLDFLSSLAHRLPLAFDRLTNNKHHIGNINSPLLEYRHKRRPRARTFQRRLADGIAGDESSPAYETDPNGLEIELDDTAPEHSGTGPDEIGGERVPASQDVSADDMYPWGDWGLHSAPDKSNETETWAFANTLRRMSLTAQPVFPSVTAAATGERQNVNIQNISAPIIQSQPIHLGTTAANDSPVRHGTQDETRSLAGWEEPPPREVSQHSGREPVRTLPEVPQPVSLQTSSSAHEPLLPRNPIIASSPVRPDVSTDSFQREPLRFLHPMVSEILAQTTKTHQESRSVVTPPTTVLQNMVAVPTEPRISTPALLPGTVLEPTARSNDMPTDAEPSFLEFRAPARQTLAPEKIVPPRTRLPERSVPVRALDSNSDTPTATSNHSDIPDAQYNSQTRDPDLAAHEHSRLESDDVNVPTPSAAAPDESFSSKDAETETAPVREPSRWASERRIVSPALRQQFTTTAQDVRVLDPDWLTRNFANSTAGSSIETTQYDPSQDRVPPLAMRSLRGTIQTDIRTNSVSPGRLKPHSLHAPAGLEAGIQPLSEPHSSSVVHSAQRDASRDTQPDVFQTTISAVPNANLAPPRRDPTSRRDPVLRHRKYSNSDPELSPGLHVPSFHMETILPSTAMITTAVAESPVEERGTNQIESVLPILHGLFHSPILQEQEQDNKDRLPEPTALEAEMRPSSQSVSSTRWSDAPAMELRRTGSAAATRPEIAPKTGRAWLGELANPFDVELDLDPTAPRSTFNEQPFQNSTASERPSPTVNASPSAPPTARSSNARGEQSASPDVNVLAQQVFAILKDRLRAEHERTRVYSR